MDKISAKKVFHRQSKNTTLFKIPINMKVFVNDNEVRTYYGAKVKSVVLAYCNANHLSLNLNSIEVRDAYGNRVDLDGSLRSNSRIYLKL